MELDVGNISLYRFVFAHLVAAAICAISRFLFLLNALALALPPFNPPNRPRATAAGFFSDLGGGVSLAGSSVAALTIPAAMRFISVFSLLERLGMY